MPRKRKPGRRPRGSGYATQAANGTWTAHYPKHPSGYHIRRGFDTRQDAEAWCDALAAQSAAKVNVSRGQQRTGEWIDAWATRSAREQGWKAKMIADVQWKLGYVKPYLEHATLSDVLPDHIDAMFDELQASLAETTIRQIRNYLYRVFQAAVVRRYITFNPVIKPERHKRARQADPLRLTVLETARFLIAAADEFYAPALWLAVCVGARAGELCGLRCGDIDLERATLRIEQEVTDLRGVPHLDLPKNDKVRTVPIPRALIPMLADHLAWVARRAARGWEHGTWHNHDLAFPGRGGRPMNPTSLRHIVKRYTTAAGVPDVKTHELRHTAGAFYTAVGCPENVTSAILGHAPGTITRHYAPADVETMRAWVEKVYQLISGEATQARATGT